MTEGLLSQLPGAFFNGDHDAGALIETLMIVRRHIENAVRPCQSFGVFQRVAEAQIWPMVLKHIEAKVPLLRQRVA